MIPSKTTRRFRFNAFQFMVAYYFRPKWRNPGSLGADSSRGRMVRAEHRSIPHKMLGLTPPAPARGRGGPTSVVALLAGHLAAEHVIGPAGVGHDDRDDQQ